MLRRGMRRRAVWKSRTRRGGDGGAARWRMAASRSRRRARRCFRAAAGHRDGRAFAAETGRDRFRLPDRAAIRAERACRCARGWCRSPSAARSSNFAARSAAFRRPARCAWRTLRKSRREFTEHLLFTHRGLSGPAMLQVSSYWQAPEELRINLFPDGDARAWLEENRASGMRLDTLLARRMPERFATALDRVARAVATRPALLVARAGRHRAAAGELDAATRRHGRLRDGGGDRGRHRHARAALEDDGGARECRDSISSARRSTSPAGSAATISSGPGLPVTPAVRQYRNPSS